MYYNNANFGQGSSDIWLDDLRCTGAESSILDCTHDGVGVYASYCADYNRRYDAGVECPVGKLGREISNLMLLMLLSYSCSIANCGVQIRTFT